ncbi:hypothetical protein [Synechococcus sp. UW105]|uniref:hypothetical protein n=1 Tax=Synechococcus sp. UW105 TaxID=337067 RepID=UPI001481E420|nr:hypothetical protein [Synechococcus sp. UW105]
MGCSPSGHHHPVVCMPAKHFAAALAAALAGGSGDCRCLPIQLGGAHAFGLEWLV